MENNQLLKFIGVIRSELTNLQDCPRQENENAPEATVEVFGEFIKGIRDVKPGNEIILLTWLDKANRSVLETWPRDDHSLPLTGVFSTRSPDRPNPLGIHRVKVLAILSNNVFKVSALEVLDKTPLIDIKPDL